MTALPYVGDRLRYADTLASASARVRSGETVKTVGRLSAGDGGGASYIYRSSGRSSITVDDGVYIAGSGADDYFELANKTRLTPRHFGAVGSSVAEDTAALNAFFAYCSANHVPIADIDGEWSVDSTIEISGNATRIYRGAMQLQATAPMDHLLKITNATSLSMGELTLLGTGTVAQGWSSRGVKVGLYLDASGRFRAEQIICSLFAFAGVLPSGDNSVCEFGSIKTLRCGCGAFNQKLNANWSSPSHTGSLGSTTQRTTISVDTLPPVYLDDGSVEGIRTLGNAPHLVRINGEMYWISDADYVNDTLTVYPRIPTAETSGTLEYYFGGGTYLIGNDSNSHKIEGLDSIGDGAGLVAASLYIPVADRMLTQYSGLALVVGREPSTGCLGGQITGFYCEDNDVDICMVTRMALGDNNYVTVRGGYAVNASKFRGCGWPLPAGEVRETSREFARAVVEIQGHQYQGQYGYDSTIRNPDSFKTVQLDSGNLSLGFENAVAAEVFGITRSTYCIVGSGQNGRPTGTITAITSTGTINRGVGASFVQESNGPLLLSASYSPSADTWTVSRVSDNAGLLDISVASADAFDDQSAQVMLSQSGTDMLVADTALTGRTDLSASVAELKPYTTYRLRFEIVENSTNFGVRPQLDSTSSLPNLVTLPDHTIGVSSAYVVGNGVYSVEFTTGSTASYRLSFFRANSHTGTQKIRGLSLTEMPYYSFGGATSGSLAVDFDRGKHQRVIVDDASSLTFAASEPGDYALTLTQDGASNPIAISTSVEGTAPTIGAGDGDKTLLKLHFDGTNWFWN